MSIAEIVQGGKEIGYWRHFYQYEMPDGKMYLIRDSEVHECVLGPFETKDQCVTAIETYYNTGSYTPR